MEDLLEGVEQNIENEKLQRINEEKRIKKELKKQKKALESTLSKQAKKYLSQ